MTNTEKNLLILLIDVETTIVENNMEKAKQLVETLNAGIADPSIIGAINDSLSAAIISEIRDKSEAFEYIVNNATIINDKEHKLMLLEILKVMHNKATIQVRDWLINNAIATLQKTESTHIYEIAKMLISMCSRTKEYTIMEDIRNYLEEI